ncbi:hypothetical protein [Brevibacillus sp. SIMBA_040]
MPYSTDEKIVIPLSIFPRDLLEKACLEVKKNKAKKAVEQKAQPKQA